MVEFGGDGEKGLVGFTKGLAGLTKGMTGVTKGMTCIDMPGSNNARMITFIASRSPRTWINSVFFLFDFLPRRSSVTSRLGSLVCSGHRSMKRGQVAHHAFILLLLVGMHGLSMLA